MSEQTIQLDLPVLLPDLVDARDECLARLEQMLENLRGIQRAHITHDGEPAQLCLHYDPNLISLSAVRRLARSAGSDFTHRYRHEAIPVDGLTNAGRAAVLADRLGRLPGMLHAAVNATAGTAAIAYDATRLERARIDRTLRELGYRPGNPAADSPAVEDAGLFRWIRERKELLLVGAAGLFFLAGWLGERFLGLPDFVTLGLYILAYLAGGHDIATQAVPGLLRGRFDTDVLMLAAAGGAALLGEWAEGAFLLFLFSLGHAGEHFALDRARGAISALGEMMPKTARVKEGDRIVERPVERVRIGDHVVVPPGDRIPVDGAITRGRSAIDQSAITGESLPVTRGEGEAVFAGTINQENALEVAVTRLAGDNTLSRVMQLVAEAQEQQSPTQQLTRRFTVKFVPAVLILVLLVIVLPPLAGWMTWPDAFYRGLLLLVAASPCALAIGTPAAVLSGIAQAARSGVLIKGGVHLENLGGLNAIAFDKTGTLTEGNFKVTDVIPLNSADPDELLRVAAAVEQQSNHPLALAVVRAAQEKGLALPAANGLENVSGRGVKSEIDGQPVLIGSLKLFRETAGQELAAGLVQIVEQLENQGRTTMVVSRAGRFLGVLALADTLRPGVQETLRALRRLGIEKLVMLTGDNDDVVAEVGRQAGVTDVRANLLPEQKLAAIRSLQRAYGPIAMIGDGVNDAPALASATVGIAMGGAGTAVALETADVALMGDDLGKLPLAVGLGRRSRAIIRQNLAIALGIIFLLILTSVLGWIELSGAVVLHEGSTILVVLNALRLLRYRI